MRKVKLPATPLTDETFKRQGWSKHISNDYNGTPDFIDNREDIEDGDELDKEELGNIITETVDDVAENS